MTNDESDESDPGVFLGTIPKGETQKVENGGDEKGPANR